VEGEGGSLGFGGENILAVVLGGERKKKLSVL